LVDSTGNPLTSPPFQFELGYFSGTNPMGMTVTWRNQWTLLDSASLNFDFGYFNSSIILPETLIGEKLYLWVNNGDFSGTEVGEWALLSSPDWIVPSGEGGQKNPVMEFRVSEDSEDPDQNFYPAEQAFFGQVEDTIGRGSNEVDKPGNAILQTYSVPEPSSVVLFLVGLGFGMRRRR